MQMKLHIVGYVLASSATWSLPTDSVATDTGRTHGEAILDSQVVQARKPAAAAHRRVISREELQNASSLADLLGREPGVLARQSGGLGSYATLSLRGSPSEQVEVWMDGQPLGGSTGSTVDFGPISTQGLERVEVLQAGESGADGAPLIKLVSRRDWAKRGVSTRIGSFGERALSGWWGDASGLYTITGWLEGANNDYSVPWDNGTKYNTKDDRVIQLANNDYEGRGLSMAVRPTASLDFLLRAEDSKRGVSSPGWDDPRARLDGQSILARGQWREDSWELQPAATLSGRLFRSQWNDPGKSTGYEVDFHSEENALDGLATARLEREKFDWFDGWVGTDLRMEQSDRTSSGKLDATVTPSGNRRTLGAEAGWRGQAESEIFGFETMMRGETMTDERDWTETLGTVNSSPTVETTWSGARFSARSWVRPVESVSVWISGAHRIRPPDFREWMGDNGFTLQTPNLLVERTDAGELGGQWQHDGLRIASSLWVSFYADPIEAFQAGSSPLVAHRNAPGYQARGIDASASACFRVATFSVKGTLQDASVEDPNPTLDGNCPRRFPYWKSSVQGSFGPWHGATIGSDLDLQGETFASELNRESDLRPGRTMLGTWLRWNLRGFTATASLRNLLDEHPQDYEDLPLAGRQYCVRIDLDFPTSTKTQGTP